MHHDVKVDATSKQKGIEIVLTIDKDLLTKKFVATYNAEILDTQYQIDGSQQHLYKYIFSSSTLLKPIIDTNGEDYVISLNDVNIFNLENKHRSGV